MHTPQPGMPGTLRASALQPTTAPHQPWACRNAALIRPAQLQGCLKKQRMRHVFPAPVYPNLPFQALVRWQPASLEKRHHQKDSERPGTCRLPPSYDFCDSSIRWCFDWYKQERAMIHWTCKQDKPCAVVSCKTMGIANNAHIPVHTLATD